MAHSSSLLFVILAVVTFVTVSATNVVYNATLISCIQNSTCPQGNLPAYNVTFALNGAISPNISLKVGDRLELDLVANTSIHPLMICQNSAVPSFCQGAATTNQLVTKTNTAGTNVSYTFTMAGTFYYGCLNHPGMGATIMVTQTATGSGSVSSSTKSTIAIAIIALVSIIFN